MANEIFVDTSGFYALLVKQDDRHERACQVLRSAADKRRRFFTTDYVIDETATLLKARGHGSMLPRFFEVVFGSSVCSVEWTDVDTFQSVQSYFLKHMDQAWSFTDCLSFCVMKERRLHDSLTKDAHFAQAGLVALLA